MKINLLLMIPSLKTGGSERQLVYLLNNLDKNTFSPNLILLTNENSFVEEVKDSVNIVRVKNYKNIIGSFWQIKKIIEDKKIDIVHTILPTANFFGGMIKLFMGKKISLITSQRGEHFSYFNKWTICDLFSHRVADFVVVNSKAIKNNCVDFLKIERGKIGIVYNGVPEVNNNHYSPPKETLKKYFLKDGIPIILSVGRFDELKGHQVLVKIISKILEKREIYLFIAGDGPLKKNVEAFVKSKGLENFIKFPGNVKAIEPLYRMSDIFVLHTFSEGFSNAVSEAMAYSLPVITTDIPANRELIENDIDGILVDINDHNTFSKKIINLLEDKQKRILIGKNARRKISKRFSIDKMVRKYEKIYDIIFKKQTVVSIE